MKVDIKPHVVLKRLIKNICKLAAFATFALSPHAYGELNTSAGGWVAGMMSSGSAPFDLIDPSAGDENVRTHDSVAYRVGFTTVNGSDTDARITLRSGSFTLPGNYTGATLHKIGFFDVIDIPTSCINISQVAVNDPPATGVSGVSVDGQALFCAQPSPSNGNNLDFRYRIAGSAPNGTTLSMPEISFESQETGTNNTPQILSGTIGPEVFYGLPTLEIKSEPRWNLKLEYFRGGTYLPASGPAGEDGFVFSWSLGVHALGSKKGLEALEPSFDFDLDFSDSDFPNAQIVDWDMQNPGYVTANFSAIGSKAHNGCGNWYNELRVIGNVFDNRYHRPNDWGKLGLGRDYEVQNGGDCYITSKDNVTQSAVLHTAGTDFNLDFWPTKRGINPAASNLVNPSNANDSSNEWWVANKSTLIWAPVTDVAQNTTERFTLNASISGQSVTGQANVEPDNTDNASTVSARRTTSGSMYEIHGPAVWSNPNGLDYAVRDPSITGDSHVNQIAPNQVFAARLSARNLSTGALAGGYICDRIDNTRLTLFDTRSTSYTSSAANIKDPETGIFVRTLSGPVFPMEWELGVGGNDISAEGTWSDYNSINSEYSRPSTSLSGQSDSACADTDATWYGSIDDLLAAEGPNGLQKVSRVRGSYDYFPAGGRVLVYIPQQANAEYTFSGTDNPGGTALGSSYVAGDDTNGSMAIHQMLWQTNEPAIFTNGLGKASDAVKIFQTEYARIDKVSSSHTPFGALVKVGDVVNYALTTNLSTSGSTHQSDVEIWDVLPNHISYLSGTSKFGGAPLPDPICSANGLPTDLFPGADGEAAGNIAAGFKACVWSLNNQQVTKASIGHVSANLPTLEYQALVASDIPSGTQILNSAAVTSQNNLLPMPFYAGSENGFSCSPNKACSFGTWLLNAQATPGIVLNKQVSGAGASLNGTLTYTLSYGAIGQALANVRIIDIFPHDGDFRLPSSGFSGSLKLAQAVSPPVADVSINASGDSNFIALYTVKPAALIDSDPYSVSHTLSDNSSNSTNSTNWCTEAQFSTANCPSNVGDSTAIMLLPDGANGTSASIAEGSTYRVNLNFQSLGNNLGDVYSNNFGADSPSLTARRPSSNTVTSTVTAPDLIISKTATPDTTEVGSDINFEIIVKNNNNTSTSPIYANPPSVIRVVDTLPSELSLVTVNSAAIDWDCSATSGQTVDCTYTGAHPIVSGAAIGAPIEVTATLNSALADNTWVENSATVSLSGVTEADSSNNTDNAWVLAKRPVDLSLVKTASKTSAAQTEAISYSIAVTLETDGGRATAGPVIVSDSLPAGLSFSNGSDVTGTDWDCTASSAPSNISCTYSGTYPVDPGTQLGADIVVNTTVDSSAAVGPLTNTATVSLSGESNTANNSDTASFNVIEALANVSGKVFYDGDSNGVFDGPETGIPAVSLTLCSSSESPCSAGNTLSTTSSDNTGSYVFNDVGLGNFYVVQSQPFGFGSSTDNIVTISRAGNTPVIDVDFGETLGIISGFVYADMNHDGNRSASGENGLGTAIDVVLTGTTVDPTSGLDVPLERRVSADESSGAYTIENIPAPKAGTYYTLVQEPGSVTGFSNAGTTVGTLNATGSGATEGTANSANSRIDGLSFTPAVSPALAPTINGQDYNFGELPQAGISGRVFLDVDRDATNSSSDTGIADVTVVLCRVNEPTCSLANTAASTQSAPDGGYLFNNIPAGNYFVQQLQPASYGSTTANSVPVTRNGDTAVANINFGERGAAIAGQVFVDQDRSGDRNSTDHDYNQGTATVTLSGTDADGNAVNLTQVVSATGQYLFDNLPAPGSSGYGLELNASTVTDPYYAAAAHPGALSHPDGTIGPQANATDLTISGVLWNVNTAESTDLVATGVGYDFSVMSGVSISGLVLRDTNANGTGNNSTDTSDVPQEGVTLTLCSTNNNPCPSSDFVESVSTSSDGSYQFSDVKPGSYWVVESQPATLGNGPGASDIIPLNVGTAAIADINFLDRAATLNGTVFRDNNADGINDNEPGLESVTITLSGTDKDGNSVSRTAQTDANGDYYFTDLPAPNAAGYTLTESNEPASTKDGNAIPGTTTDALGSGTGTTGTPTNADTISAIALSPGGSGQDFDFAELPATASVSGSVWRDRDSDRNYSSAENAVPGWLVQLLHIDPIDGGTTVVAEQVTGNDGKYQFTGQIPGDYQIVFRAPATGADGERLVWGTPVNGETGTPVANSNADIGDGIIRRITLRADEEITQQSLPLDPSGVVYDSVERVPVPGAIVTLNGPAGYDPSIHLLGGTALASQTTANTGEYQFLLLASAPPGVYSLTVVPPAGYSAVSSIILPEPGIFTPPNVATDLVAMVPSELAPAHGEPTTYYTSFNLTPGLSSGVVHNHLPIDPDEVPVLFVSKQADRSEVELGDSLKYTVRLHNRGSAPAPALSIEDMMPLGFKYIEGTAKFSVANSEARSLVDPIGKPGPALFFVIPGSLAAGEALQLTYRARVGVGADRGDGINRATGVTGALRSAEAQARVTVTGGVLGHEACLAGRIFVDCNNNHIQDSEELGIPGVRLYAEDGRYLISDVEGKYGSCDFTPQTHVLKVDRMTLPRGSRLTTSSSRNVGDANSLFVDLKNGELHRADFIEGSCSSMVLEQVRARRSNGEVIQSQIEANAGPTLSQRSNTYGVNRGTVSANQTIVRDRPLQGSDYPLADSQDQPQSVQRIQQGVDFAAPNQGDSNRDLSATDLNWNDKDLSKVKIQTSKDSESADGLSAVEIDVQLQDADGQLLQGRQLVTLIANGGHLWLPGNDSNEHGMRTADLDPNAPGMQAWARDGRIKVQLLSPDQPKTVTVQAFAGNYHSSRQVEFLPALREWIAAGLVEGIVRLNDKSGLRAGTGEHGLFERELQQWQQSFNNDRGSAAARVAFFVKGTVRGKYLLTASYDSEKNDRARILQEIKPEQLYPVFGDASVKGFEAQSSGKLFVRLSRDTHYLLYGDFQSENGSADLGANNRTLTGARLHLEGETGLIDVYAANDTLRQRVEELTPNGTSGPYGISGLAVENTERVELITRDRSGRAQIIERRPLTRLVDYSFDAFSGRMLFKEPVSRTNGDGNPQTIRISYEQDSGGSSNLATGLRAELQVNDWIRIGTSYSYNQLDVISEDQLSELASADFALAITEWLNVSAELAQSTTLRADDSRERRGSAAKVEITTGSRLGTWSAALHAVQSDVDFRNSNASAEAGRGEIALRLKAAISENFSVNANVQRSTNEITDAKIDSVYLGLKLRPREGLAVSAGIRHLKDNGRGLINSAEIDNNGSVFNGTGLSNAGAGLFNGTETIVGTDDGNALETTTLLLGADWMATDKLTLGVEAENSVAGDNTWRASATAGWKLNDTQTLQARYETQTGLGSDIDRRQKSRAFVFGLTRNFDEDGSQFSELRLRDSINGREAHLAYGIRNGFDLGSGLRGIASVEQVAILNGDGRTATSGALGVSNSTGELWKGSARVEGRRLHDNSATPENNQADSWLANLSIARKLSDSWTALAKVTQLNSNDKSQDGKQSQQRIQMGAAYRPVDNNRVAVLAKLERRRERNSELATAESRDLWVASVNSNWHPTRAWWLGARLASKDVDESLEGAQDRYRASLAGVRAIYDVTERMDVGLLGSYRYSPDGHTRDWATGIEMGYSVQSNLWLSLGYNWGGFSDRDLSGSDYTERGWYIRLRYKFDEDLFNGSAPSVNRTRSRSTNSQEDTQ